MKSLYEKSVLQEVMSRIEKLSADQKPVWGKMNAAQMMEHCSLILDFATGRNKPKRMFLGYILGPIIKNQYYNDEPLMKNSPTAKDFIVADQQDFEKAKNRLVNLVKEFSEGGEAKCTTHPSAFFGKLTPAQHGMGVYKHTDHHLQQFGV